MTLFASVLTLNRADVQALQITDPYSLHRVVYSLFEDVRTQDEKAGAVRSGILYAEREGNAKERCIVMLSDRLPSASAVTRHGGSAGTVRSQALPLKFLEHERYHFKVVVNPTRRDNATKKLVPIRLHSEIENWFSSRGAKNWGFEATSLAIERVDVLRFSGKNQQALTLSHAHIGGQLLVTDRSLFQQSFAQGLGRNSAFGCGLLQLVPATNPFDFN